MHPSCKVIATPLWLNSTVGTNWRRKELMTNEVREIKHGSFSQLVFSTTGGIGTTAIVVYKQLAWDGSLMPGNTAYII